MIDGPFTAATELRLHVLTVSTAALLVVEADGKQVFQKQFQCGPGKGEWKKAEFKPQWQIYQNLFDRDYTATIPAGTRQVRVRVADGDWLEIGQIGLKPASAGAKEATLALKQEWGKKPEPFRYAPDAPGGPLRRAGHAGQGLAMEDLHRALESGGVQGDRRHGGRMGRVQQDAARRRAALGRGLPEQLAAGRLGLGDVELPRLVRRAGQQAAATCPTKTSRAISSTASSWTCSSAY